MWFLIILLVNREPVVGGASMTIEKMEFTSEERCEGARRDINSGYGVVLANFKTNTPSNFRVWNNESKAALSVVQSLPAPFQQTGTTLRPAAEVPII